MARKLKTNLVALGSAAIVAVYAAGYALTEHVTPTAGQTPPAIGATVPAPDAATAIAQSMAAEAPPGGPLGDQAYRDGTYAGTGRAGRGQIAVKVTIDGGKVTGVKITHSTTYFPTSQISRLPGEVVKNQSADIDFVSGATQSSLAFRNAVAAALAQAGNGDASAKLGPASPLRAS